MADHVPERAPTLSQGRVIVARRRFVTRLSFGLAGVAAALTGLPILGFLVEPLFRGTPEVWRAVGPVESFTIGQSAKIVFEDPSPLPWAGIVARTAAWLRRDGPNEFVAYAVNCTHLGCPVSWLPDAQLFMCPCHGGVYNADGSVAAGPPPKPLRQYGVRVQAGNVEILTGPLPLSG